MSRSQPAAVGIIIGINPGRFRLRLIPVLSLFLVLFLSRPLGAQTTTSLSGQVFDAFDGSPLGDARVLLVGTVFSATSDQLGNFRLEHVPPGTYGFRAEADGYQPETIVSVEIVADITRRLVIHLKRKPVKLSDRQVTATRPSPPPGDYTEIGREQLAKSGGHNIADILEQVAGVYVQQAGPDGSASRVSIRGSEPKHVLMLIDGQRTSGAGEGTGDLGAVPLAAVEKIEIYRGGQSARFGSDAIGGVINIITRPTSGRGDTADVRTGLTLGAWHNSRFDVQLNNPVKAQRLTSRLAISGLSSDGNFPYRYVVSPQPGASRIYAGIRQNGSADSRSYFVCGNYLAGPATSIGFSGQLYTAHSGLPGSVSDPDTTAWMEDRRMVTSATLRHTPSPGTATDLSVGFSRLQQHFNDLENVHSASRFDNRFINDRLDIQSSHKQSLWRGNNFEGGISAARDILYHDDFYQPSLSMHRATRDNLALHGSDRQELRLPWLPLDRAALDGAVRWDRSDTRKDSTSWQDPSHSNHATNWSGKIGMSLSGGDRLRLTLRASYGNSYQLPSMNALFWKGDVRSRGNPGLLPERARHGDGGIEIAADGPLRCTAGITWFRTYVNDLIVWQPGYGGVWQPVNLDAALMTGHEEFVRLQGWNDRIRIDFGNTVVVAKNKAIGSAAYDNHLTFRPGYVTSLSLALSWWKLNAAYDIRWVGRRYSLDANTKWYDPYCVDNLSLSVRSTMGRLSLETGCRIKNLRNENYVLIGQYPMPGREWGLELQTIYRFN